MYVLFAALGWRPDQHQCQGSRSFVFLPQDIYHQMRWSCLWLSMGTCPSAFSRSRRTFSCCSLLPHAAPQCIIQDIEAGIAQGSCSSYALGHSCRTCTRPLDSLPGTFRQGWQSCEMHEFNGRDCLKRSDPAFIPFFELCPLSA